MPRWPISSVRCTRGAGQPNASATPRNGDGRTQERNSLRERFQAVGQLCGFRPSLSPPEERPRLTKLNGSKRRIQKTCSGGSVETPTACHAFERGSGTKQSGYGYGGNYASNDRHLVDRCAGAVQQRIGAQYGGYQQYGYQQYGQPYGYGHNNNRYGEARL